MNEVVATIATYRDMLDALRARAHELQISRARIGELMGISWAEKTLTSPPIKHLSLANAMLMIHVLRLRVVLVHDPSAPPIPTENRPFKSRGRPVEYDHATQVAKIKSALRRNAVVTRWQRTPADRRADAAHKAWRTRRRNKRKRKVGPECGMQQQLS